MDTTESRSKIFINPEFKKAHINRNFLTKSFSPTTTENPTAGVVQPNIHFNPAFLQRLTLEQNNEQICVQQMPSPIPAVTVYQPNPIIKHTKRKLVRASSSVSSIIKPSSELSFVAPLVKISRNKLVRSVPSTAVAKSVTIKTDQSDQAHSMDNRFHISKGLNLLYKLDRRISMQKTVLKSKSSIRRYSLIRTNSIVPHRVVVTDRRLQKLNCNRTIVKSPKKETTRKTTYSSQNKKLVMININGVLYRSSSNKLQLSSATTSASTLTSKPAVSIINKQRCLTIRGTKFLLDPSGTKLRKIASAEMVDSQQAKLGRIDIGGLTYMPKTDGTFVRTDNHRTRSYLSLTKHKSIQVLANQLRKCNVPCPIYRRLGKCVAFMRGKCPKLHDKNQIMICSKFLKGECINEECLLSHNVSLEKMPVCHFFLEGRCTKGDCPYLHKKVSEKERICENFLKGFCSLADKCPRRHEFICPQIGRFGFCEQANCPYPHGRRNVKITQPETVERNVIKSVQKESQESGSLSTQRYYLNTSSGSGAKDEPKLTSGQKLQLQSMLTKIEKMKQGHSDALNELTVEETEHEQTSDEEDQDTPIRKRTKLGPLPSFIPI